MTHPSLAHKTLLVTRAAGQSSAFTEMLVAQGAEVVEMPALEIRPPSSWEPLDWAIAALPEADWLMLTSANAVTYFLNRLADRGKTLADLQGVKIAVVGKKTAAVLKRRGLTYDFVPPEFVADSMVEHFPEDLSMKTILFPRVETGGRKVLIKEMTAAGAKVVEIPAYESGCPTEPDAGAIAALQAKRVDAITFASSKTVSNASQLLQQGLGASWLDYLGEVAIASIGPQTSKTCYELLGRVDVQAQEFTLEGLALALAAWSTSLG